MCSTKASLIRDAWSCRALAKSAGSKSHDEPEVAMRVLSCSRCAGIGFNTHGTARRESRSPLVFPVSQPSKTGDIIRLTMMSQPRLHRAPDYF
jgi:hypothetical protein